MHSRCIAKVKSDVLTYSMGTNESLERGVRGGVRERESGRVGKGRKGCTEGERGRREGGDCKIMPTYITTEIW